jgi:GNAT superfamily N-acetyltransferase
MRDAPLCRSDEPQPERRRLRPPQGPSATARDVRTVRLVTLLMYERGLDRPAPPVALPDGVELIVMDRFLATGPVADDWHPGAAERLREGQTCAIARHGTDIVAYCWLAGSPVWVSEIGRAVVPARDDVYFYDAFTAPEWRGRGLFSATLSHLVTVAASRGRKRGLIFVEARNRASRRVIEKTGFQLVHRVSCLELGRFAPLWLRGRRLSSSRVVLVKPDRRAIEEEP